MRLFELEKFVARCHTALLLESNVKTTEPLAYFLGPRKLIFGESLATLLALERVFSLRVHCGAHHKFCTLRLDSV